MGHGHIERSKGGPAQNLAQMRDVTTLRISRALEILNFQVTEIIIPIVEVIILKWHAMSYVGMRQPAKNAEQNREIDCGNHLLSRAIKMLFGQDLVVEEHGSLISRRSRTDLSQKRFALQSDSLPTMHKRQNALVNGISEQNKAAVARTPDLLRETPKPRDLP